MNKILVAGAGQGGLVCANLLAREGYDVTVIEKDKREGHGYPWPDCISINCFEANGMPLPPEDSYFSLSEMGYRNPKGNVLITAPLNDDSIFIERKPLAKLLIDTCEESGVKFLFEKEITGPIIEGNRVVGLVVKEGNKLVDYRADLVIDSAGLNTPVRRNLPISFGIRREISEKEVIHIFRGDFENLDGTQTDPAYVVDFFHCNKPGIDWIVTGDHHVDILIGKFGCAGELTQEEIDEGLATYRERFPYVGELIRGGDGVYDIPITKMLPLLVANGYVLIGDGAGMTFPLNGSGIVLSMNAGKILAETVIAANGNYSKAKLWPYQYRYFQEQGKDLVIIAAAKNLFNDIKGEHVDYLLEEKILTKELIQISDGIVPHLTLDYFTNAFLKIPKLIPLVPSIVSALKGTPLIPYLNSTMPEEYDKDKVAQWVKTYSLV